MDTTDRTHRLALPYLANDQAQKHVTVNEGLRALDALVHTSVVSAARDAQPASPVPGDAYLMTSARTGEAWAGLGEHDVAAFQDGAWARFAPTVGMTVWVQDEARHRVWDGAGWVQTAAGDGGGPSVPRTRAERFGVNADADDTNRLTVKSDAVLHSHDDASGQGSGSARHVINKAGPADTASLVFQSGYAGRAEMGLVGSDDFSFKVSADGASFAEAIRIDARTGAVTMPNTDAPSGSGSEPGSGSGGVTTGEVAATAQAFADGLAARLVAEGGVAGGNLARSRQVVLMGRGKVQVASAADANVVEVYADGAALAAGDVRERRRLARGEVAVFEGLPTGAVVTSAYGVAGASESTLGTPIPLGLEGFAARRFFLNAFRGSENGRGKVLLAAGAVPATVRLLSGDGQAEVDRVALGAFETGVLRTQANGEHQVVADQPVFAGVISLTDPEAAPDAVAKGFDSRLLPPLSDTLIGWAHTTRVSALYPGTTVRWHAQNGQSGTLTASPGAPAVVPSQDPAFAPRGAVVLRADGPITALAGADGAGTDAIAYMPVSALGQLVPLPFGLGERSGSGFDGIAVASPYQGTARVFASDGTLAATLPLVRQGSDQDAPCAALAAPDDAQASAVLTSFAGGWIEADVPICVVQNASDEGSIPDGLNGGSRETMLPGVTPEALRTRIRRDEAGRTRRWRLDGSGQVSWPLC